MRLILLTTLRSMAHLIWVTVYAYYAVEQMSALQGRLHVLLGARDTEVVTNGLTVRGFTPEAGLLIKPFSQDSIFKNTSFFVNYSRSFTPSGEFSGASQSGRAPDRGIGMEMGIKPTGSMGAVASTMSVFRDDRDNIAEVNYIESTLHHNGFTYFDLGLKERSEGAELDLIYTPSRNLQVAANYTWLPIAKTIGARQLRNS